MAKDYELTNFYWDGDLETKRYRTTAYRGMVEYVKNNFSGNSLNEKIEQMALTMSISQKDIDDFRELMTDTSSSIEAPNFKCATPTICYENSELTFSSSTVGAEYVYKITNADIKEGLSNKVKLDVTYEITVYATKEGYEDSDVATATLTWIEVEPRTGDLTTGVNEVQALPVLIKSSNGVITVTGADDGMKVEVFGLNGVLAGSARSYNGTATVNTSLQSGSVAIVKIGEKSVKVTV